MKANIIIHAILLFCLAAHAPAQESASGGSLAERFRQYDKNGDGKVTREEAGPMPMFDQWDTNKDGAVTMEELQAFYTKRRAAGGATDTPPAAPKTGTKPAPTAPAREIRLDFVPDAPFVGEVNGSYIDPEFSEGARQVVFQDIQNRVWIGDIDPETGLFKTATGRDCLMDENITIIFDRPPQGRKFSTNGPEWTCDEKGHCVVYTKADKAGIMQQWMARLAAGKSVVTQLTHNKQDSYGNMPSRFADGKPPRVGYTYDWPIWKARAAWIFADKPDEPHNLDGFDYNQMSMWSAVSPDFLFVKRAQSAPHGQIARASADTGRVTVLTNDEGEKNDPGMFRAPEFDGEICLMANVDNRAIAIYRDLKSPDGYWTRVATLTLPADAPHAFISSPEPIAPATGIGGVSYVALLARESKDRNTPGSIWVFGLGKDPNNRFVRRVDHAAGADASAMVLEPEPFIGKNEVFVYYNFFDRTVGKHGLRRAATGIKVAGASTVRHPAAVPAPAQKDAVISVVPELAKPSLEVCLTANDEAASRRFLSEGLGLAERPAPSGTLGRLLLFTAGDSTIKVRQHNAPKTPPAIAARNGLRVLTVPVEKLDDVAARMKRLGFECSAIQESGGTRWALARNADGTPFELTEGRPGDARQLEIGLVVPDLARAREFFTAVYGAKELPEATSRVLAGERELRFTTGATVFKCWSPPGERESDSVKVADLIGFRYITHNVRDSERLHAAFQARGIEIATPLTNYRGIAKLFFARGPRGVLLEFLTLGQPPSPATASSSAP